MKKSIINSMISVVVPVFNEEESIAEFYKDLVENLKKIDISYEIIFVDDGSIDGTLDILKNIEKNDKIRTFSFRRNQGKAKALMLGFQKAQGDYIITLDGDLQDKPKEISKLLEKAKKGNWDVVCGWRKKRKDPISKVLSSKLFNSIATIFLGLRLHDYNCGLKLYSKEAAKSLNLYGGMHRFIPLLAHDQGFTVTEVIVEHDKRKYGKSKYGFSKIWKDLPDIFTMLFLAKYGQRPLHFFGLVGGFLILIGAVILIYLTTIWFGGESIGRRPLLLFGILLVIAGLQIFFTGFLAELIINSSKRQQGVEREKFILKYESS
jgi:glycosyltransferase involved in cell wall biosynthesis